jgi:hypothetical protein
MKNMNDLAQSIMGNIKRQEKDRDVHWEELMNVIEEEWKDKIMNLGYQRGVLQIGVSSSVIHQEISQFQKAMWLQSLKKAASKIKDIKIKIIDEVGEPSD